MAHPLILVEYSIRQFIQHWYLGLQPNLKLTTLPMGEISVSLNVSSSSSSRYHRHKSGRKSRFIRCNRRSEAKLQSEKGKEVLVSDTRIKAISSDQPFSPSSNLTSETTLKHSTESSEHSYDQPCNSQPSQTDVCVETVFSLIDAACQTISEMDPVSTAVQAVCDSIDVAY